MPGASLCLMLFPPGVGAQHVHDPPPDSGQRAAWLAPIARGNARAGSGTAWLPDDHQMRGLHLTAKGWRVMIDGNVTLQYVRTSGIRRQWQLGSTNWLMTMADRDAAGGVLQLRGMVSAEPATLTRMGYPQLFQVAQAYRGGTLTDRQHPHELLSEIALRYVRPINSAVAAELYLAPVGEPAIGPVAYRHRPSAENNPAAPLGHHVQDITHTTFGVATVALFTRVAKLEASIFNGRHPDDRRTNLEIANARLDSYAGRLTINPARSLSLSGSFAWIDPPAEAGHAAAHGARRRATAAVTHVRSFGASGISSSSVIYSADFPRGGGRALPALLAETNLGAGNNAVFGRVERVRRASADLALTGSVSPEIDISALSVGAARTVGNLGRLSVSVAAHGTLTLVPGELDLFYGSRSPVGLFAHVSVRPHTVGRGVNRLP